MTKEAAREKIARLVERFEENYASYKDAAYNETQARREFIDPFFKALGWDIDNEQGLAEAYKEVIHEDRVKVDNETKAPDYCFTVYGQKKFFVEAKKPSVRIKEEIPPAYQVRRYGWSAKLPVSLITDFEEFAVYDCTKKPKPDDKPSVSRIEYFTFREYLDRFDFLWDTFSKEGVLKGNLDRYVSSDSAKKGTATVDREFLKSMDEWRTQLASNIALRNADLDETAINTAVQLIIDRLIFLRICEDREIEPYGAIRDAAGKADCWKGLSHIFIAADQKYNSGLFDFRKDTVTQKLSIDDKVIKSIIAEMYYPACPYQFAAMPVEILGNAYEQFLGKVIRLTNGHRAKIEEKPEVRKAGGVYYTPQYIVDYIVKHTLGELLAAPGMTPEKASELKILDPACGSGSFLLGAYQYLLDWHVDYYRTGKAAKKGKFSVLTEDGRLSTAEKKRILLNNIYGVDIDAQAVEVTKLSLLLKCLEGETGKSLSSVNLLSERILPTLDENIKCGNSLIGPDYFTESVLPDLEELKRVNPFDWKKEFKEVFERTSPRTSPKTSPPAPLLQGEGGNKGGFDCVIGNPPYVRQEMLTAYKPYYEREYGVYHGVADLYTYFIEKGYRLLRPQGKFGIIVANKWMRANYGDALRKWLKTTHIDEIIDFGDLPIFQGATTYPCILRLSNTAPEKTFKAVEIDSLDFLPEGVKGLASIVGKKGFEVTVQTLAADGWQLCDDRKVALLDKLKREGVPLKEYVGNSIYRGVLTGLNEAFVVDIATKDKLIREDKKSAEVLKPFLAGRDVKRYEPAKSDNWLILFPKGFTNAHAQKGENAWKWLQSEYPAIARHLALYEAKAKVRCDKGDYWWELRACDYYNEFDKVKIICPAIVKKASYMYDADSYYSNDKTTIIASKEKYLLAVLNSKMADFVIHEIASTKQGGFFEYKPMYISQTPIRTIDFSNPAEKAQHDRMVALVDRMLDLHKKKAVASPAEAESLGRLIAATDDEIDRLVYELYGLAEEEIRIVEGK